MREKLTTTQRQTEEAEAACRSLRAEIRRRDGEVEKRRAEESKAGYKSARELQEALHTAKEQYAFSFLRFLKCFFSHPRFFFGFWLVVFFVFVFFFLLLQSIPCYALLMVVVVLFLFFRVFFLFH